MTDRKSTQNPDETMSESESDTEAEFDSKQEFIEAVQEDGAVLGDTEYFTKGSGSATSYKARTDDGEIEDVNKADVESAWEKHHGDEAEEQESEDEPEEVHLGTFYFSKANWDTEQDRDMLEEVLEGLGWYIDGEVDSGGYRIQAKR